LVLRYGVLLVFGAPSPASIASGAGARPATIPLTDVPRLLSNTNRDCSSAARSSFKSDEVGVATNFLHLRFLRPPPHHSPARCTKFLVTLDGRVVTSPTLNDGKPCCGEELFHYTPARLATPTFNPA
jgi:hypothetical protein